MHAVMCWIVWKYHNQHVFNGEITNLHQMIGQAWSRLDVYVKIACKELLAKVRMRQLSLPEAIDRMSCMFGNNGKIWTLHGIEVQVSPVSPRPP